MPAFPWPPPRYSAFAELPRQWIAPPGVDTLGAVARRLEDAFEAAGYGERSYFRIPGGFALASRIEEIGEDASPLPLPRRWSVDMSRPPQGFFDYIRALFDARPGLYRVIVFTATDASFTAAERSPTPGEARGWMYGGLTQLPESVGAMPYGRAHHTTALIYEFERRRDDAEARVRQPSGFPGRVHLERAGLAGALARR